VINIRDLKQRLSEFVQAVYFLVHVLQCAWLARLNGTAYWFVVVACLANDKDRAVSQALVSLQ
jgi:predicted HD phosphohydrolase